MASRATIAVLFFAWCASAVTPTEAAYEQQRDLNLLSTSRISFAQRADPGIESGPISPVKTDRDEPPAAFGDLAVRTTGTEASSISDAPESRRIAVSVVVHNTGNSAVCATFTSKLKTTSGIEYRGTSVQAPSMHEMPPGDYARGNYIFEVKEGDLPLELILNLDDGTTRCKSSIDEPTRDAAIPSEIRLDLRHLPGSIANSFVPRATLRPGGITSYPRCVYCPAPRYTEKARHSGLQGTVQLKATVGANGLPTNVEIVKGLGQGLDEQAVSVVQTWRFDPAVGPNGNPVATVFPIEITFRLSK